ncbi:hypothetical protein C3L33_11228, partial [Rhododendron williamsianum]
MDQLKPSPANSCPLTPLTFLERAAIAYGEIPSIIYNATTYTWSQTHRRCQQLASSIQSLGIGRGHVVSVVAPNTPAMYELHFAVPMTGAILNTINTRLDARMISVLLQHSESKIVFVDKQFQSNVIQAIKRFPPESQSPTLVLIADNEVSISSNPSSSTTLDFTQNYEDLVEKGDPEFKWVRPESEQDPMTLNYTSGTTSSPKGVVHSHRSIFIITINSLIDWPVPKHPVYLWTLPMFHSNGWSFSWGMAAVGGTNICLRKFDVPLVYHSIRAHSVTHMCGAPVLLNMLSKSNSPTHRMEVERVLYGNEAVEEAAVVARPDEFWGETVCAFLSLKGGVLGVEERDVVEFCRERLPHYMVPKTVVFMDELPKTSTGKIQKVALREIAKSLGSSPSRGR